MIDMDKLLYTSKRDLDNLDQQALKKGSLLGRGSYEIKDLVGRRQDGFLYLAQDIRQGKEVLIREYFPNQGFHYKGIPYKVMREGGTQVKLSPLSTDGMTCYQRMKEGFKKASSHLAKTINDLPIIGVLGGFDENGTSYRVLENPSLPSLRTYLKKNVLIPDRVLDLYKDLVKVIDQVHQAGYCHGSIGLDTIYLDDKGLVLGDFDLCPVDHDDLTGIKTDIKDLATVLEALLESVGYKGLGREIPKSDKLRRLPLTGYLMEVDKDHEEMEFTSLKACQTYLFGDESLRPKMGHLTYYMAFTLVLIVSYMVYKGIYGAY